MNSTNVDSDINNIKLIIMHEPWFSHRHSVNTVPEWLSSSAWGQYGVTSHNLCLDSFDTWHGRHSHVCNVYVHKHSSGYHTGQSRKDEKVNPPIGVKSCQLIWQTLGQTHLIGWTRIFIFAEAAKDCGMTRRPITSLWLVSQPVRQSYWLAAFVSLSSASLVGS